MTLTYQQIMPLILALLLIFIIPMLMRKHGWDWGDVHRVLFGSLRKKDRSAVVPKEKPVKKEPFLKNGGKGEMIECLSTLITFARRNQFIVVYPGTMRRGQEITTLLGFLVTKSEVIGINCFGYAGTITVNNGRWNQHMNGADISIGDPAAMDRKQQELVRAIMDANDMKGIPMRIAGIFTNRDAVLAVGKGYGLYTTKEFIEEMKVQAGCEEAKIDCAAVSKQLSALKVELRKQKR